MLFTVFNLEKSVPLVLPLRGMAHQSWQKCSCSLPSGRCHHQKASSHLCTCHLGAKSELSSHSPQPTPGALCANLFEIFSSSMALASNCVSCFPPSIGTPSSLPDTDSNLNKPARTKAGGGRLIPSPFCAQAETKAVVVADSSRARIPKNPRSPVAPSGSPSTESQRLFLC